MSANTDLYVNVICLLSFGGKESMAFIKFLKKSLTKILKVIIYRRSLFSLDLDKQTGWQSCRMRAWRASSSQIKQWATLYNICCMTQHCQSTCPDFGALLGHSPRRSILPCLPCMRMQAWILDQKDFYQRQHIIHSSLTPNVLVKSRKVNLTHPVIRRQTWDCVCKAPSSVWHRMGTQKCLFLSFVQH